MCELKPMANSRASELNQMLASQYESLTAARWLGSMIGIRFKRIITIAEQLGYTLEQMDVKYTSTSDLPVHD